jgi:hypothetical protein
MSVSHPDRSQRHRDRTKAAGSVSREEALNTNITHWPLIIGRDVKAGKVAVRLAQGEKR